MIIERQIIELHSLRFAERLDLAHACGGRFHLVHAGGRGAQLEVPNGWLSLWLPLRGELQLESPQSRWLLPRAHLLIAREPHLQGGSRAAASWLALAAPAAAWNLPLQSLPQRAQSNEILPRQSPCPRGLRRVLVHLARQIRTTAIGDSEATLREVCAVLLDRQRDLQPLLDRCNGRTPQRRQLTLQRLLRVHQLIERDGEGRLDLQQLARYASYSPWHLIRMYREVFGETPSEHASRLRLHRAWTLVRDSAMPVCTITEQLGFESQSAFCRAFKNAYGLTTTQVRHLPVAVLPQASLHAPRARTRIRRTPAPVSARR